MKEHLSPSSRSEQEGAPEALPPPAAAAGGVAAPLPRLVLREEPVTLNAGRRTVTVMVTNTGDRPVQIGSHYHFFEANRALRFDRAAAFGMRLNIPAGTARRFEPGDTRAVELVPLGGARRVIGFHGLVDGSVSTSGAPRAAEAAHRRAAELGFLDEPEGAPRGSMVPERRPPDGERTGGAG